MPIGTGLAAQLGFGEEITVGTGVTPTRFYEFNQESLKQTIERVESNGLGSGRQFTNNWVVGRKSVEGDVEFDVTSNGFGVIPKYLVGGTPVTTTPGGGTLSRLHTTKVGALDAKSLTTQVGRPTSAGVVTPFTYAGCKVASWELDMAAPDGILNCKMSLDGMSETTATALATPAYPAVSPLLSWSDVNIIFTIGGTNYSIKHINLQGNNALKTDRYALGSPNKKESLEGTDKREYSGTIDMESYLGTTAYQLFTAGTEAAIVAKFTGANIETTLNHSVQISLARVRFDGETPNVGGPDMLENALPFKVLYSPAASTSIQFDVTNTDIAA